MYFLRITRDKAILPGNLLCLCSVKLQIKRVKQNTTFRLRLRQEGKSGNFSERSGLKQICNDKENERHF